MQIHTTRPMQCLIKSPLTYHILANENAKLVSNFIEWHKGVKIPRYGLRHMYDMYDIRHLLQELQILVGFYK